MIISIVKKNRFISKPLIIKYLVGSTAVIIAVVVGRVSLYVVAVITADDDAVAGGGE
jgi:hypothetical protein